MGTVHRLYIKDGHSHREQWVSELRGVLERMAAAMLDFWMSQ